jgi:hypothetical protein
MPLPRAGACIRIARADGQGNVMPSWTDCPDPALDRVWARLAPRLGRSAAQSRRHGTRRLTDMPCAVAGGALVRVAHGAAPGERLRWVDLAPGARLELPLQPGHRFGLLVCHGEAAVDGGTCAALDYCEGGAAPALALASDRGARLMVHEHTARHGQRLVAPTMQPWQALAPGLSRRLLAPPHAGAAPCLVRVDAGTAIPPHRHRHAEACLLLDGEMHSEDLLLFGGDFQLVPAGGLHRKVASERGALLYIHGDVEIDLVAVREAD